jgi:flagellar assembly factor FliW
MDVQTKTQGIVQITDEQRLEFVSGLLGFENETQFALIPSDFAPFYWMQSLQSTRLAFLVVDPFLIRHDYEVDIDDMSLKSIGVTSPSDVSVLGIVTVPTVQGQPVTVNLQGPIVVNKVTRKCFQAILHETQWTTKHEIATEIKKRSASC